MNTKQFAGSFIGLLFKIIIIGAVIYYVGQIATQAYDYGYRVFAEPSISSTGNGRDITVAIPEGQSVKDVGEILFSRGLIRDSFLFQIQYYTSKYNDKEILAGSYTLNTEMVVEDMLGVITTQTITN